MTIHIGNLIRQRLNETGMSKSEFARRINTTPQNIYGIFKRKSIDSDLLTQISEVLEYNFFEYFSNKYTGVAKEDQAVYHTMSKLLENAPLESLLQKIVHLEAEVDYLRKENSYLKEINLLLKEKKKKH